MSDVGTYTGRVQTAARRPFAAGLVAIGVVLLGIVVVGITTGSIAISSVGTKLKNGVMRGLVIGLAGIGLSMTYSILGFANFAHGDFITAGAFAGWATTYLVAGIGEANVGALLLVGAGGSVFGGALGIGVAGTPLAVLAGVIVAGVATVGLALATDRLAFRPIRDADGITLLITSVGVAFVLRYLLQFVFGPSTRGTTAGPPKIGLNALDGPVFVSLHDVALLVVAGGLMAGVHLLLQRTRLGKAMRAMADNEDLAKVTGIPTEEVVRATWVIGGGLTGVAGYMFVLWKGTLSFNDGWLLLLLVFAAVILGGIGSIYGAITGGLVIGLTQSLSVLFIPPDFARAAAFLVMIVILIVKPEGIFSGRATA